jgi:hypothetical protein
VKLVPIHLRFCLSSFFTFLTTAAALLPFFTTTLCSIKIQFAFEMMVFSFMVMKHRLMLSSACKILEKNV